MKQFLEFLGIEDVEFVYAESWAVSEAAKEAALAQARSAIERLALREPAALAA